jgi:hypothetical protein
MFRNHIQLGETMRQPIRNKRVRGGIVLVAVALTAALLALPSSPARAANSPTFRDCSVLIGLDPDFVQLYGVALNNGALTVRPNQATVQIEASESSDPGDSAGHVTLDVTARAAGVTPASVSGHGTGLVTLTLHLPAPQPGRTYTINWSATFDNGVHACPAVYTLANTPSQPNPFVVTVRR